MKAFRKIGSFGAISIVPVVARSAEFLALPLITRVLDIEGFGVFDKSMALAMLLSVGSGFFLSTGLHRLYRPSSKPLIFSTFIYGGTLITIGWFALSLALAAIGYKTFPETFSTYLGTQEVFATALAIGCSVGFFRLQEVALIRLSNLWAILVASLLPSMLFLVGCLVATFVELDLGFYHILFFKLIVVLLQVVLGLVFLAPHLRLRFSKRLILIACRFSLPFLPGVGFAWISRNVMRWIILGALGISSMAIFSAGLQLAAAIGIFTQVFQNMWFVFSMKRKSSATRNLEFSTVWIGYFGCISFIAGALTIFGEWICTRILPSEYASIHVFLPLLVIGISFVEGRVIGNVANFITGRTLTHIIDDFGTAAITVVLSIFLVPEFSLIGVAIAFAAGGVFQILRCHRNAKIINLRLNLFWPLMVILCVAVFSVIRETGELFGGLGEVLAKLINVTLLLVMAGLVVRKVLHQMRPLSL